MQTAPLSVDAYIAQFPDDVQALLAQLRHTVTTLAPDAEECISYGIPTYKLAGKNLVHFAAFKKHIGLYPGPSGIMAFANELKPYQVSKGTVQFPLQGRLPLDIIRQIVRYRMEENIAAMKKAKQRR